MRLIPFVIALASFSAFACENIPAELNFRKLSGDFQTITGSYRLDIDFPNMTEATCTVDEDRTIRIENSVVVKVSNGGKVVQSFTTDLNLAYDTIFLIKPKNMTSASMEISTNKDKKVIIRLDGAAIFPTVTR